MPECVRNSMIPMQSIYVRRQTVNNNNNNCNSDLQFDIIWLRKYLCLTPRTMMRQAFLTAWTKQRTKHFEITGVRVNLSAERQQGQITAHLEHINGPTAASIANEIRIRCERLRCLGKSQSNVWQLWVMSLFFSLSKSRFYYILRFSKHSY